MEYPIIPLGKPRMTQRDKWAKRPAVLRYRAFKDECRLHGRDNAREWITCDVRSSNAQILEQKKERLNERASAPTKTRR